MRLNRFQKKALIVALGIANISLTLTVATVSTVAWYYENHRVTATGMTVSCAEPNNSVDWEILRYVDDEKAGRRFTEPEEFYLQDYDQYITQKNIHSNCILVATITFQDGIPSSQQLYVDVYYSSDLPNYSEPTYNSECPSYTSNVCQFKSSVYSYTTSSGVTEELNSNIDGDSELASERYSSATNYFAGYNKFEKFTTVINNTPYKRSKKITLIPDMSGLSGVDATLSKMVLYIECSYNPDLVDYYVSSHSSGLSGNTFSLVGDISRFNIRTGNTYTGAYVKVNSGTLSTDDYLILDDTYDVGLDGSLDSFTSKNYIDIRPSKNRIKATETTQNVKFSYNSSSKALISASNKQIYSNGSDIAVGSQNQSIASVTNGNASIVSNSKYLGFDSGANVTKFNYATSGTLDNISVYQYDEDATGEVAVSSISITTPTTDLAFNKYDKFSHTDLVVTATYSDGSTEVVTNNCEFSIGGTIYTNKTPLTVTGSQSVTIKYYDPDDATNFVTTSYNITIDSQTLTLDHTTLSGYGGETGSLTATPSHFTNTPTYTWTSSNPTIATVSGSGASVTINYLAYGIAVITCRATNGSQTASASCEVTVTSSVPVTGITLDQTSATLAIDETLTLTPTVTPANASNKTVYWETSDDAVATVTSAGVVTGRGAGTCTITATTADGGHTATCSITVSSGTVAVTGVVVTPTTLSLTAGNTSQLTATIYPNNATNQNVTWTSNNESVATVSSSGLVTAVAAGNATITVTTQDGDFTATCSVTVSSAASGDAGLYSGNLVEGDYVIFYDGKAMKNTVTSNRLDYNPVTPSNDTISNPDASIVWHIAPSGNYWTIYNASVAKYAASNGTKNQAALNASGTADYSLWTVSGTSTYEFVNKYNDNNSVNANLRNNGTYGFACYSTSTGGALSLYKVGYSGGSSDSVSLDKSTMTLTVGETGQLNATASGSVTWTSSDESIATVSSSGLVTAKAAGSATITATCGNASATCTVTVSAPDYVTAVSLDKSTMPLTVGGSNGSLTATLTGTVYTSITWTSSNPSIASVTGNGTSATVAPADNGSTTITVTVVANGNTYTDTCTVNVSVAVTTVTDTLDRAFTGVTSGSTSYSTWSGKTGDSDAVYAGNSAGGNDSIQLRSSNSNSGIVTTASGGTVSKITITWNSSTSNGRTLNIYGKTSAYTAASNLYSTSTQGTLLGTIVYGTSTSLTITGNYTYIGLRSASGAMYISSIEIEWK